MNQKSIKKLRILAIVLGVVFLASIIVGAVVLNNNRSSNVSSSAKKKIQDLLSEENSQHYRRVVSKYGFSLQYDKETFVGEGHVLRKESNSKEYRADLYSEDELNESRAYAILKLIYRQNPEKDKKDGNFSLTKIMPELSITTSRKKNYFDRSTMPDEYKDTKKYSDLDLLLQGDINSRKKKDPNMKYRTGDVTISGLQFKKLVVDYGSTFDGKWQKTGESTIYMTIQNGRPYWISIFALSKNVYMQPYIDQLESLVGAVTFHQPDESYLVSANDGSGHLADSGITLAKAENFSKDKNTTNTLSILDEKSIIKVVARNQISTVRVGTIRCSDMIYTAQNGATMRLNGLCSGGIGSGSIVSDDGYIATNGHVTEVANQSMIRGLRSREQWDTYCHFMINAGYITRQALVDLIKKSQGGDQSATAAIQGLIDNVPIDNIRSENDRYDYIIQTSNDPIVHDRSNPELSRWKRTPTNVSAKKIDAEVNLRQARMDLNSDKTDVAILKIDGRFPAVDLGDSNGLSQGDQVTAIGYPAVVDNGTQTKQAKTVPTVTQGSVSGMRRDAGGHKLFSMTAQIAAGNSGGPAFDKDGKQIGLNTYGGAACANSNKNNNSCFGSGVFRDIADLKSMAKKNNVNLSSEGELTKLWKDGLEDFSQGKYSKAKDKFEKLDKKYSGNYLVTKMIDVASNTPDDYVEPKKSDKESGGVADAGANKKSETDKTDNDTVMIVVVVVIASTGALFLIVSIIAIIVSVSSRRKFNAYPQYVVGQYPQQSPYQQQGYQQGFAPSQQYPPQQSPMSSQQYPPQGYYQQSPGQYPPTPIQPPGNYPPTGSISGVDESKNPPTQS